MPLHPAAWRGTDFVQARRVGVVQGGDQQKVARQVNRLRAPSSTPTSDISVR
jgi:hypothetical protein